MFVGVTLVTVVMVVVMMFVMVLMLVIMVVMVLMMVLVMVLVIVVMIVILSIQIVHVVIMIIVIKYHIKIARLDSRLLNLTNLHLETGHFILQAVQNLVQLILICSEIQKSSNCHITADSGTTIQI